MLLGSIVIGLLYRDRNNEEHGYRENTPEFEPGNGYDTAGGSRRKDEDDDDKCIICYDSMKRYQSIRILQCAHKFHSRCINGWLRYERFCPLCKTAVV